MKNQLKKYYPLFITLLFLFILSSCSAWNNFTAYFNRFYIAEKAFEDGMENIEQNQQKPLFQFKEEKLSSAANKNFDDVIKYSSKILQFNKDTKYVNEAIYMIAKAYYYKGLYSKALRKFHELEKLNDKDLRLETMLWIAKTEMQMRNFNTALERLQEIKEIPNVDEDILFTVYVTEISYLIYREEYSKAILAIEELLHQDIDDKVKSEVTFELGMLYQSLGNYQKAVNAFEIVWEGEPTFEIEFKSKLEYAKTIKHLQREEEALEILQDLRDNTKYEEYWDLVDLEIAQIELEAGKIQTALEIFYSIDTGYVKNESSGIATFMQGDIMEHLYMDFDSAKTLYDKVASKKAPSEYKKEAKEKAKVLKLRKDYLDNIFNSKKGYQYLQDTLLFKQDSLAYAGYLSRRDSAMKVQQQLEEEKPKTSTRRRGRKASRGTQKALKKMFVYEEDSLFTYEPKLPNVPLDSMRAQIAKNEYELGNLYFAELLVPDSAYYYYNDIITNYPNTPYQARTLYAMGSYYLTLDEKEKADSLFQYVYDNYSSDPIAKAAASRLGISVEKLNSDPVLDEYYIAEAYIEKEKYYDAIEKLNSIYETYPKSLYAPKALYSIGWIYENKLSDYDMAVTYYDSLKVHYPKTEYARDVSIRLNFYHREMKAKQDSIARAEKAIADSIKADSLARIKETTIVDSASVIDSLSSSLIDSSTQQNTTIPTSVQKDSIKQKEKVLSDSARAVNLFKQAKEQANKGKK